MKSYLFKHKRIRDGKLISAKHYSGRYRLSGMLRDITISLHTPDKQIARARLERIVAEHEKESLGLIPSKSIRIGVQTKLTEFLKIYIGELEQVGRNARYLKGHQKQILAVFKACRWSTALDVHADAFRHWRAAQTNSAKTLNEYLTAVQAFMNWCVRSEKLPRNPLSSVERIERPDESKYQRRSLTDEEAARLIKVSGEWSLLYHLALGTGLRRGELAQLEWRDIWLDTPEPCLRARAATTKNGKEATLPLTLELTAVLEKAKPAVIFPNDPVFPISLPRMPRVSADFAKAGIARVDPSGRNADFHSLRHTFCTRLAKSGASLQVAMALMRHSDPKLTTKVYTDLGLLPTRDAILALPSLIPLVSDTPESTLPVVPKLPNDATPVTSCPAPVKLQPVENQVVCPSLSRVDFSSPEDADGARCRVRTCRNTLRYKGRRRMTHK